MSGEEWEQFVRRHNEIELGSGDRQYSVQELLCMRDEDQIKEDVFRVAVERRECSLGSRSRLAAAVKP